MPVIDMGPLPADDPAFRGVGMYFERPRGEAPPVEEEPTPEEPVEEEEDQTESV